MPGRLLQGRWLYVGLFLVVIFLYARLFTMGSPLKMLEEAKREQAHAPTVVVPKSSASSEITLAELAAASERHHGLGLLLVGWSLLSLGLGLGGLVLTIRAWQRGQLRQLFQYRSHLQHWWSMNDVGRLLVLLALIFSLFPFVSLGLVAWGVLRIADTHLWMLLAMLLLEGFLILFVWGFASSRHVPLSSTLGLSWRAGPRAIWHGLVTYVTVFPWIFGLLWLLSQLCQWFAIQPPTEPIQELLFEQHESAIVGLTVALSCVAGPIAEEIFFRGIVFTALRRHTSRVLAMLVSASVFSAAHTNAVGFVPILLLGCVLAYVYERTGSLWSSIAVHIVHNSFLVGLALTMKALVGHG